MKNLKSIRENLQGACWKGYEAIGTKKKNDRTVPNCVPKNESAMEESPGTAGHESTVAAKASAEATRHPSKENHLKAMEAHKKAQGFFKSRAAAYHENMAITHAKKASEMKEGASEEYGAGFEGTPELVNRLKSGTPGQQTEGSGAGEFGIPVNTGAAMNVAEDHEKMMAHHHELAHKALKSGDLDSYHKHLDMKYSHAVEMGKVNAAKPVKQYNEADGYSYVHLEESKAAVAASASAHQATVAARSGGSAILHDRASAAHTKASETHSRAIDKLMRSSGTPDKINHHEAEVKKHDQQAQVHRFYSHRLGAKKENVDEAAGADEHLNSRIVKQTQAAVAAAKKGDKYAQQYHLAKVASLKRQERGLDEEVQSNSEVELNALDDKDRTELNRLTILVRLGLMEQKDLLLLRRSLKKIKAGRQVTNLAEKRILFQLLENLVDVVIGDPSMFNKLRVAVARDRKN